MDDWTAAYSADTWVVTMDPEWVWTRVGSSVAYLAAQTVATKACLSAGWKVEKTAGRTAVLKAALLVVPWA